MVKKRNSSQTSYVIPHSTMDEMMNQIHKTHNTGKEHGMSLCIRDNKIIPGKTATGSNKEIIITDECSSKKDKHVGSFHTHPDDSEVAPSAADLYTSCFKSHNLSCIGKNDIGEIVCYEKKQKNTNKCMESAGALQDIEDVFFDIPQSQLYGIKKELYQEVDKVADKHFIKIRLK